MLHGIVAASHKERQQFWNHWVNHCHQLGLEPSFAHQRTTEQLAALVIFAQSVRNGKYSARTRVRVQMVQVALRAIGQTFELDGRANPCYQQGQ